MEEEEEKEGAVLLPTLRDLLVQDLQEDVLIDVLHVDEVGVVSVDGLFQTLELLWADRTGLA